MPAGPLLIPSPQEEPEGSAVLALRPAEGLADEEFSWPRTDNALRFSAGVGRQRRKGTAHSILALPPPFEAVTRTAR